jgi:hypothetical protein
MAIAAAAVMAVTCPFMVKREKLCCVRVRDGNGADLDAEYSVERDGEFLALILESASGPSGSRAGRNTDYRRGLAILLARLRALGAVIQDALVDSAFTQRVGILEAERRLLPAPVRLVDEPDIEALRLRLTSAQSRIGQAPGTSKGGNSSKRIRLRVTVAGFSPEDAALLTDELDHANLPPVPLPLSPGDPQSEAAPSMEAQQIEEAVAQAAGKATRPSRGQGFQPDQVVKVAVKERAMKAASEFYGEDWDVEDVHGNQSYDLVCRRDGKVKHVEVKGTTTGGTEVILTPNEVRHAREYQGTALFILSNIVVERSEDGIVIARGGDTRVYDPWSMDDGMLLPLGFRYQCPMIGPIDGG